MQPRGPMATTRTDTEHILLLYDSDDILQGEETWDPVIIIIAVLDPKS